MDTISFDGQQTGERILHIIRPHRITRVFGFIRLSVFFAVALLIILGFSVAVPQVGTILRWVGLVAAVVIFLVGLWWLMRSHEKSVAYITDRRIIRFEMVTPFFSSKRALFWNEALKAKAYAPGMWQRVFGVGTIEVEPHLSHEESVRVTNVHYYEDVANYIDKILYLFKNQPAEIAELKPFVAKPRGKRY